MLASAGTPGTIHAHPSLLCLWVPNWWVTVVPFPAGLAVGRVRARQGQGQEGTSPKGLWRPVEPC